MKHGRLSATVIALGFIWLNSTGCIMPTGVYLSLYGEFFPGAELIVDGKSVGHLSKGYIDREGVVYEDGAKKWSFDNESDNKEFREYWENATEDQRNFGMLLKHVYLKPWGKHNFLFIAKDGSRLEISNVGDIDTSVTPSGYYFQKKKKLFWFGTEYDVIPGQPVVIKNSFYPK